MREIVFRGKRKDNGEWVYGSLLKQAGEYISKDEIAPNECRICGMRGEMDLIAPETIGQYTGLTDKNGLTKIFEGDIVKVYDVYCNETVVGVVEFCDGSFRICDTDFTSYYRWMDYEVEVIGNVFDNPELLGGQTMKHGIEELDGNKINSDVLQSTLSLLESTLKMEKIVCDLSGKSVKPFIDDLRKVIDDFEEGITDE